MILLKKKTPSQSCFCLLNPICDISSSSITALLVYVAVRTMFITELSYKHHLPVLYIFITELMNNEFNSGCKSNNGSKFNRGSKFNSGSNFSCGCNFNICCNSIVVAISIVVVFSILVVISIVKVISVVVVISILVVIQ